MPASTRGRSPAREKATPSKGRSSSQNGSPAKSPAKKARKLPVVLWAPNLIGYVRLVTLVVGARCDNPASSMAIWCLTVSLLLDYIDGPVARKLNQCSKFGDLLDHYCDHITMMYLVYVTYDPNTWFGVINVAASALHNGVACLYMLVKGHYMKHGSGNLVTKAIEKNNYWNMWSLMWNFNTCIIPLVKLSYIAQHKLPPGTSTLLLDVADACGMLVSLTYTVAMWV